MHEGACDEYEKLIHEKQRAYKRCPKCQAEVENKEGNHMTCDCGFEFCYVCRAEWKRIHFNNHD